MAPVNLLQEANVDVAMVSATPWVMCNEPGLTASKIWFECRLSTLRLSGTCLWRQWRGQQHTQEWDQMQRQKQDEISGLLVSSCKTQPSAACT